MKRTRLTAPREKIPPPKKVLPESGPATESASAPRTWQAHSEDQPRLPPHNPAALQPASTLVPSPPPAPPSTGFLQTEPNYHRDVTAESFGPPFGLATAGLQPPNSNHVPLSSLAQVTLPSSDVTPASPGISGTFEVGIAATTVLGTTPAIVTKALPVTFDRWSSQPASAPLPSSGVTPGSFVARIAAIRCYARYRR
jgi:hypothetical protein